MSESADVLIIGGGVIGLTTAYFLAKEGVSVEVIDQGALGGEASWAGAGIISPGQFSPNLAPIDQLRSLSVTLFPELSIELRERTGIDNGYRVCGGIEFLEEEAPPIEAWQREGIAFDNLSAAEATRLEPHFRGVPGSGYHFPQMAQVRNPWHLRALIAACASVGVKCRPQTTVEQINLRGGKVEAIRLGNGTSLSAGRYLLAAGAWTNPLLAPFRQDAGIHPVRGQIVLLKTPQPLLQRVILVGANYLVPRADGRLLIGATVEPEAGFEKRTTVVGVASLLVG